MILKKVEIPIEPNSNRELINVVFELKSDFLDQFNFLSKMKLFKTDDFITVINELAIAYLNCHMNLN